MSQRKTDRDTKGNLQKSTNLGEIAVERRNNTTQSPKGNKPDDHNILWGKKEEKALSVTKPMKIRQI